MEPLQVEIICTNSFETQDTLEFGQHKVLADRATDSRHHQAALLRRQAYSHPITQELPTLSFPNGGRGGTAAILLLRNYTGLHHRGGGGGGSTYPPTKLLGDIYL